MEVLWKLLLGVINWRIGAVVHFHNVLHGFRVVRVMGTASLKAKMFHHLTAMKEEVVY